MIQKIVSTHLTRVLTNVITVIEQGNRNKGGNKIEWTPVPMLNVYKFFYI